MFVSWASGFAVAGKMRGLGLPVWCLAEVDNYGVYDVIQKYIELVQKEGYEAHKKAIEIGKIAIAKPTLSENLASLLTEENCRQGMLQFWLHLKKVKYRRLLLKSVQVKIYSRTFVPYLQ